MSASIIAEQLLHGLGYGLMLFLLAAGLTLVFGVMDTMNLSHGTLFMVGAYIGAVAHQQSGSFLLAICASVAGTTLLAALLECTLMRRLYAQSHLVQVVATLGVILIVDDVVKYLFGAAPIMAEMPAALAGPLYLVGEFSYPAYRVLILLAGLAVAAVLYAIVNHTRLGMLVRAGASNRGMAEMMGVRVSRVFAVVFALGAALAGLAGALMGPLTSVQIGMGESILIPALVVIVIGGIGSIRGAMIASLLVGLIDTVGRAFSPLFLKTFMSPVLVGDVAPALSGMLMYLVMAVVLCYRPTGLFTARG